MRLVYRISRFMCQVFFLTVFRGRTFGIQNVPREGSVLLVCNHQSFLDPMLATLAIQRECHYMARDSLFKNPRFKRIIETFNAYPIKRGTADVGAIKETLKRLKRGELVTTFPEGTRTPDGRVQPMHGGMVVIARRAKAPIVPAMVLGAFEAWPRHARLPYPRPVIVAYGQALRPEEYADMSDDEAIELLRGRIVKLIACYRRHPLVRGKLGMNHKGTETQSLS